MMKTLSEEFGFYAHHPEEMDEVYGVDDEGFEVIRGLFDFIQDDEELLHMLHVANSIGRSASEQAKDLTTQVRSKMRELIEPLMLKGKKNKIADAKNKRDWYCGLEIQKAGLCAIEAWVDISTEGNSLIARTFLWTLELAPDDIRNEIFRGIALPQALGNDDPQSLIIGEVNLRDAFDRNVTIDMIVEELTKPLTQLKADDWSKLHLLAPQRTNKSVQSSSAARRSAR